MKNCPFCNEEIFENAIVCVHCGKSLNAPTVKVKSEKKPPQKGTGRLMISISLLVILAVTLLVVGFNFYNSYYYSDVLGGISFIIGAFMLISELILLICSLLRKISVEACTFINFVIIFLFGMVEFLYLLSEYI